MNLKVRSQIYFTAVGITLLMSIANVRASWMDSWFDSYGKIGWTQEVARLRNFEKSLKSNPEMIGYVAFNWSCEM